MHYLSFMHKFSQRIFWGEGQHSFHRKGVSWEFFLVNFLALVLRNLGFIQINILPLNFLYLVCNKVFNKILSCFCSLAWNLKEMPCLIILV